MSLALDTEYVAATEILRPGIEARPVPKLHDIATRRANLAAIMKEAFSVYPPFTDVVQQNLTVQSYDGTSLSLLHTFLQAEKSLSATAAIVHCHGGGMIAGSPEMFAKHLARLVRLSSVPIFSVNYRKAPEHPHPTPTEDVYAALQYIQSHAAQLNIDPARIAIMGESAGGGIAAGVTLMARDRELSPPLAGQILVYPMLDDTNLSPDPRLVPFAFWTYESNLSGWTALLGKEKVGKIGAEVSPYAAPSRAKDLSRLPKTYIDVGELDIFRDEDIAYLARLTKAGVPVEFHLHPGVPHAFDWLAPNIKISEIAYATRARAMKNL